MSFHEYIYKTWESGVLSHLGGNAHGRCNGDGNMRSGRVPLLRVFLRTTASSDDIEPYMFLKENEEKSLHTNRSREIPKAWPSPMQVTTFADAVLPPTERACQHHHNFVYHENLFISLDLSQFKLSSIQSIRCT